MSDRQYLSQREAAAYLGVSFSYFKQWLAHALPRYDAAPAHARRRAWRYDRSELDAYMKRGHAA